jgi:hypothetical protein
MKMVKNRVVLVILLFVASFKGLGQVATCQQFKTAKNAASIYYSAENLRSDTIDIVKYTINVNITDFVTDTIRCNTTVKFAPKLNGQNKIRLDLLKMFIDSIKLNTTKLTYTYNDTVVKVNLPLSYNTTDTLDVTLFYHGRPQGDASGWGGFYFSGNYAFNLGVGFAAKPHNYGRVWFPCFDNFVEKSKYEFNITSDSTKRAYCNGQLISDIKTGSTRTRKWVMQEEIPTYLASIAVADYTQVSWTHTISTGTIPIILAARAPDTTVLKSGFVNFKNCLTGFENYYGPYKWNRVGYCLVPFNSGAMEHATNIAYPLAATSIAYEATLMAHEFAHHWWGDLMTCETQEDMWLNEGFASYSEYMFREWQYGKPSYIAALRTTHDDMLHFAHFRENKFWPVSGVPHQYTYGDHVYKKGAVVAHTLRSYMGDVAFFNGVKYVMAQKSFKTMNSAEFKTLLETSSGQLLSDFFNNWVFDGGWPHFSIDSTKYVMTSPGNYLATVYVKQKLTGAPSYYNNVPLEISFFDSNWQPTVRNISMSGANQTFTMNLPFAPLFAASNYETKIADAIAADNGIYKLNGNFNKALGKCIIAITNKGADSSFIRVEHNYTAPDPIKNNIKNYKISNQHYWRFDGVLSAGFVSKLHLNYDGNMNTSGTWAALDTCLTSVQNDSIIVLYRKNTADDWKLVDKYTKYKTGATAGKFIIDTLRLGEYTFANKNGASSVGIKAAEKSIANLKVYPNPATNNVTVKLENYNLIGGEMVEIKSIEGKVIYSGTVNGVETTIDCSAFAKGNYLVRINKSKKIIATQKLVLQ